MVGLVGDVDAEDASTTIVTLGDRYINSYGASPANHVVIVELGQNDCENYYKLDQTRANLHQILTILGDKGVPVLVVGTTAYASCGAEPFLRIFSELATKHGDSYSDFKEGVTGHPELLQPDHDHPNAAGNAIIVRNMLPVVDSLLAQVQRR